MDLKELNKMLTTDVKEYLKGLYLDQRFNQPLTVQYCKRPKGVLEALAYVEKYKKTFPDVVRASGPGMYNIYIDLSNTNDSLERLALWSEFLDLKAV